MSWTIVELDQAAAGRDPKGKPSAERVYRADGDSALSAADLDAIVVDGSIPLIGSAFPSNPQLLCTEKSARQDTEDRRRAIITCSYKDADSEDGQAAAETADDETDAPWDRSPDITTDWRQYEVPMESAWNNRGEEVPVVNSAGQQFDPTLMDMVSVLVIRVSRATQQLPSGITSLQDSINESPVVVAGYQIQRGCGRLTRIAVTNQTHEGEDYYELQVEIEAHPRSWARHVADMGTKRLVAGKLVAIRDGENNPIEEPVKLDGAGAPMTDQTAVPVYITFWTRPFTNWSALDLPRTR